jgi:hypothetical protein
MAIGGRKTVWILGAGFSRSLGAPLLDGLFRQQFVGDFSFVLDATLAANLVWTQAVFNYGKNALRIWDDAEEFLSFVDAAFGDDSDYDPLKRAELLGMIGRTEYLHHSTVYEFGLTPPLIEAFLRKPAKTVRRALGFETSRFLRHAKRDETWKPYLSWAKTLQPETDSVVTFNYDLLLEKLGKPLHAVMPGTPVPAGKVPIFKMHGSTDWVTDDAFSECGQVPNAIDDDLNLAIAAPGRSKASFSSALFKTVWDGAASAIKQAAEVVIVGYSFPKSDALARMTILDSLTEENCGAKIRRAHLVLGPEVDTSKNRRVLELLRYRMGDTRPTHIDELPPIFNRQTAHDALLVRHRLWAEDFIADYNYRTREGLP